MNRSCRNVSCTRNIVSSNEQLSHQAYLHSFLFTFLIYHTLNSISVTFYFHNHFTPKILSSALLLYFREIESKCNNKSLREEKYEILSSETMFPSPDFATTTSNLHSQLTVCLLDVSHRAFQIKYSLAAATSNS